MKRSPASSQASTNLSASVHHQLNMYAIAAGTAGVSLFALAQPAAAKIVYTPANVTIGPRAVKRYHLDFNHDGITDVTIRYFSQQTCLNQYIDEIPASGNGAEGKSDPLALSSGAPIGRSDRFYGGYGFMAGTCHAFGYGNWLGVTDRYLGLKFKIHGKIHFGWARMSVFGGPCGLCAHLTGYAYETIPGKSIIAGKTKGPADDPTNENFGPAASLTSPIPDRPQPVSLGMLALGAQ
jgi:hypothetical protein